MRGGNRALAALAIVEYTDAAGWVSGTRVGDEDDPGWWIWPTGAVEIKCADGTIYQLAQRFVYEEAVGRARLLPSERHMVAGAAVPSAPSQPAALSEPPRPDDPADHDAGNAKAVKRKAGKRSGRKPEAAKRLGRPRKDDTETETEKAFYDDMLMLWRKAENLKPPLKSMAEKARWVEEQDARFPFKKVLATNGSKSDGLLRAIKREKTPSKRAARIGKIKSR